MAKMYFQYGFYKPLVNIKIGRPATLRQLVPPFFLLYLAGVLVMIILKSVFLKPYVLVLMGYLLLDISISIFLTFKKSKPDMAIILPILFPIIHLSYGSGYLLGLVYHPVNRMIKRSS